MKRIFTFLLTAFVACLAVTAQTDMTSRITNPSFEQDAEGWMQKGMGVQGNSVFDIKDGSKYMERWTGRGGAVGDGYLKQELRDLPPGNYELSAAAQNIQEDTPKAAQTGACIFAGDKKTTVTVRDTYTVAFNYVSGAVTIGFEAAGATGNWIAVDNFRLTLVGTDLSADLAAAIEQTETTYGNATGTGNQQVKDAISAARIVADKTDATAEEQAVAILAMQAAVEAYLNANASPDQPRDMTSYITNQSFETGDFTGWTMTGMALQGNSVFSIKQGNTYVERWTGRGGAVGDARLSQTLRQLPPGRYRLKAVAQNIQEDTPSASQTGAWIFAGTNTKTVTVRATYTLEFVLVSDVLEVGFEAKSASGNWLAVDNFRLEYIGDSFEDIQTEFAAIIAKGEALAAQKTNTAVHQTLSDAIAAAQTAYAEMSANSGYAAVASTLEAAIKSATASQEVFARLATAITDANAELNGSAATQKDEYQTAITAAQTVYDTADSDEAADAAITALAEATFAFRILNGGDSGTAPEVTTDPRYVRGCTWAFGRSTVSGADILEQGFCWSENPDPRVTDFRTTEYINQAGRIYWLRDLKPATVYYMRAYAINKDYAVGYGDVIKFVTVPKGTVGHWYNNGGDEATNDRINYAINTAIDYYWNNLTSIHGFGISVNYSPGTPTADCSYGGWMRVGESSSYQQPGTIMHEAFHGIGVGTHDIWWNGEMRSAGNRGVWLGDRTTEAVRFWDNSTTAVIDGDDMHLWPYGCNGAHEDTHNDNLYCMMGILAQSLGEDGLPASGEIGYALPYYAFNHSDGVKYYIKNEDESRGLRTAYLVETATHQLQWQTMTAEEAAADDHAAWYITFTPSNQYYQLRNAATGYYMTYSSGFKTANHSTPTSADNIHLMRGRVDVTETGLRGYYFIHPESNATPPTLTANASGKTAGAAWNLAKSATTQRWIILTAAEAEQFDNGNLDLAREELNAMLARIRTLAAVPHTEDVTGTDATLATAIDDISLQADAATKGAEVSALTAQAKDALMAFLACVTAIDEAQPFDLTFMLQNPDFTNSSTEGWTTNHTPGYDAGCDEFYETTFDFYQSLTAMPAGTYQLHAQAFQRAGETAAAFTKYNAGTERITTSLYVNTTTKPVASIYDDRQSSKLYDNDIQLTDGKYVPCVMQAGAKYFSKGFYDSSVTAKLKKTGTLKVGIKCTSAPTWYWTFFDNFRLYFLGGGLETGIAELEPDADNAHSSNGKLYDLSGRRIENIKLSNRKFSKGIYILDGRKRLIK